MKNFQQTPKQKRTAIAVNKACFANSRKATTNNFRYGQRHGLAYGAAHIVDGNHLMWATSYWAKQLNW